jgi:hypothetical protein
MDVAYSLVRQSRVKAQDLFTKHSDPFRTVGRELVCCCECGQPVMLRGSLGGRMRPHFAHYKLANGKIEDAVPCDSRVSGGSREYIKGEQKKHKTYGLGYLIRRFELYQSIALWRDSPHFIVFEYINEGIGSSPFDGGADQAWVNQCRGIDGDNLIIRIMNPKRRDRNWQNVYADLAEIVRKGSADEIQAAAAEYDSRQETEFIKRQTLFRASLRTDALVRPFLEYCFSATGHTALHNAMWKPAIDQAESPDAALDVIEAGRSAELASNLYLYLCSKASERNRFSVLVSSIMLFGHSLVHEVWAKSYAHNSNCAEPYAHFDQIRNHLRSVSEQAAESIAAGGKPNSVAMLQFASMLMLLGACGNHLGDSGLNARLICDLQDVCKQYDDPQLCEKVIQAVMQLTMLRVCNSLATLPYRSVFNDVLHRPEDIEKHYRFTNSDDGFIYLGHDPALDQIWHKPSVKVGRSIDPERRGRQLAGQCLPRPLRIHRVWYVSDMRRAEQLVFQSLHRKRSKGNREIFHLQVSEAAGRIDSILRRSNLLEVG